MADRPSATSDQKPSADTTMVRSATARAIRMVARLGRIIRAATVRAITPSETTAAVARTRPSASHRPGTPLQTLRDRTGSFSYSPNDYPPFLAMSAQKITRFTRGSCVTITANSASSAQTGTRHSGPYSNASILAGLSTVIARISSSEKPLRRILGTIFSKMWP